MQFLYGLLTGGFIGIVAATFLATLRYEKLKAKYEGMRSRWCEQVFKN